MIRWVDLPGLYEGCVRRVGKSWSYAAKVRRGEVEGKVRVALKVGIGGGHGVVRDVLSKFCIL